MGRRVSLLGCLLAVAVVGLAPAPSMAQDTEKDPLTAGLLGGLLGFGSGYYYTKNYTKGAIFSGVDLGLVIALAVTEDDEAQLGWGLGLVATHIWQGFDGAAEARKYNRRHGFGFLGTGVDMNLGLSPMAGYSSEQVNSLWAEGGTSRDLAYGLSLAKESQTPFRFNLGVSDPGVGMSWSTGF